MGCRDETRSMKISTYRRCKPESCSRVESMSMRGGAPIPCHPGLTSAPSQVLALVVSVAFVASNLIVRGA